MKMNKIFLMILALALITVSCKKNEEETPTGPNPTQQWIIAVSEKTFTFSDGKTLKFGKEGVPDDGVVAITDPVQYTLEVVSGTKVIIGVKDADGNIEVNKFVGYELESGLFLSKTDEGTKEDAKKFDNMKQGFDAESKSFVTLSDDATTGNWLFTKGTYISEAIPLENDATKKTFKYVRVGTAGQIVFGTGTGDAEYVFDGDDGTLADAAKAKVVEQAKAKSFEANIVKLSSKYYAAGKMYIIASGTTAPYTYTPYFLNFIKGTPDDDKLTYDGEIYTLEEAE